MISKKNNTTIIYILKNITVTFIVTLLAFVYHIMIYYQIFSLRTLITIIMQDMFTILYFVLVWILNYLLFEIYKMVCDLSRDTQSLIQQSIMNVGVPLLMMVVMWFVLPTIFRFNGLLLGIFMIARLSIMKIKQKIDS